MCGDTMRSMVKRAGASGPGLAPASTLERTGVGSESRATPVATPNRLTEYLFALNAALWLCAVSVRLRGRPLPQTLERISPLRRPERARLPVERVMAITERVCHLALFRPPWFPRICLRRSLVLYRFLGRMGYAVRLHVGVRKRGGRLEGHSWITIDGRPIADGTTATHFQELYHYPPRASRPNQSIGTESRQTTDGGKRHEA